MSNFTLWYCLGYIKIFRKISKLSFFPHQINLHKKYQWQLFHFFKLEQNPHNIKLTTLMCSFSSFTRLRKYSLYLVPSIIINPCENPVRTKQSLTILAFLLASVNHESAFCFYEFIMEILDISYKWNHTIYDVLCLLLCFC